MHILLIVYSPILHSDVSQMGAVNYTLNGKVYFYSHVKGKWDLKSGKIAFVKEIHSYKMAEDKGSCALC